MIKLYRVKKGGLFMKLNLLSKMGLIFTVLLIVNISVVMFSISTLSKQESDGVVINIAGRQRMLSQKMSKESFLVASGNDDLRSRSEEHTSELQSHSFISYAVFCLKKKTQYNTK